MSKLRFVTDSLYWLMALMDAVSSLILLHLGFVEGNGLYVILGNYGFWLVYVGMCVLFFAIIKGWQQHYRYTGWSVVSYGVIFMWVVAHAVCTTYNIAWWFK